MLRRHALEFVSCMGLAAGACNSSHASSRSPAAQIVSTDVASGTSGNATAANPNTIIPGPGPAAPAVPAPQAVAPGFGFLTAADIAVPTDITTATASEVTSQLTGWDVLAGGQANDAAAGSTSGSDGGASSSSDCLATALATTTAKGTDTKMTLEYQGDIAECETKVAAALATSPKYSSFAVHYVKTFGCDQGGLSKASGKTEDQLRSLDLGCATGVWSESFQLQIAGQSTVVKTINGQAVNASATLSMIDYHAAADLSPCTKTLAGVIDTQKSGCVFVNKLVTTAGFSGIPPNTETTYQKSIGSDIAQSRDASAVWPSSGTRQLSIANWTGSLVYAGPQTAPTYTLKDSSGAVVKGVLPAPGASLTASPGYISSLIAKGIRQMQPK